MVRQNESLIRVQISTEVRVANVRDEALGGGPSVLPRRCSSRGPVAYSSVRTRSKSLFVGLSL